METLSLARRLELGPLPLDEAAQVMGRVAQRISDRHARGILHRELHPDSISLGATTEEIDVQEPSLEPVLCGGPHWDPERFPAEFGSVGPMFVSRNLAEAQAAFAAERLKLDPTQIDIYQLGVLFNRVLTGESVTAYLSSPKVKSRVPETRVAADANRAILLSSNPSKVKLWDLNANEMAAYFPKQEGKPLHACFSEDESSFYVLYEQFLPDRSVPATGKAAFAPTTSR